jgi:hypothetical protein
VTNEERERRFSSIEMDANDLRLAYRALGDSIGRFIGSIRSYRPDAFEAFWDRWREQRRRCDAEAERMAEEIFEANVGVTNDGPDRWSVELDIYNHERNKGK